MGVGASSGATASGIEIISPRIEMTKKGPKEAVLDSVPLSDVDSGTVHYRYNTPGPSVYDMPGKSKDDIPTGYFFHPKLKDYSELGDPATEDAYKFIRVSKGPRRYHNQNLYYVTGIGFGGANDAIPPAIQSLRHESSDKVYGHKYFDTTLAEVDEDTANFVDGVFSASETQVKLKLPVTCTALDVRRKLGHHFLWPLGIIHVSFTDQELVDDTVLKNLFKLEEDFDENEITLDLLLV